MASRGFNPGTTPVRSKPEVDKPAEPIAEAAIAARAHELWLARGCPTGSPEVDWFQAEQELRTRTRTGA